MELNDLLSARELKPSVFARQMGYSKSHICHILARRKKLTRPLAIRIYREMGVKMGPIAQATDDEIDALERFQGAA